MQTDMRSKGPSLNNRSIFAGPDCQQHPPIKASSAAYRSCYSGSAPYGSASALHAGWKAAQTLVEWASGIASGVRVIVDAARAKRPDIVVACTRKAVPLTRGLSIKAVRAGGGVMHRTGLSDTVLLFAEHRAFLPEMDEVAIITRLRAKAP